MSDFYRGLGNCVELFVRLTPKAGADAFGAVEETADGRAHVAARVRAVPEKGAANTALERLVADRFGVGRSKVSVIAGHTARLKTVRIDADPSSLRPVMEELAKA
jgi:uncharacterized protein YggU (UPF0235/DUF167 family)